MRKGGKEVMKITRLLVKTSIKNDSNALILWNVNFLPSQKYDLQLWLRAFSYYVRLRKGRRGPVEQESLCTLKNVPKFSLEKLISNGNFYRFSFLLDKVCRKLWKISKLKQIFKNANSLNFWKLTKNFGQCQKKSISIGGKFFNL